MKRLILAIAAAATTLFAPAAIKTQLGFEGSDGTPYDSTVVAPSTSTNYPFADFGSKYLELDDGYEASGVFGENDLRVFDMYVQFTAMTETPELPTEAKIAVYADGDGNLFALSDADGTVSLGTVELGVWVRLTIVSISGGYDIYVDGNGVGSVSADDLATTVEFTGSGKLDNFVARTTDPFSGAPTGWIAKVGDDPEQYYTDYTDALTAALNGASLTFNGETEMDGTAEHPFEIRTAADLVALQQAVATTPAARAYNYVQTADIDMSEAGAFAGIGVYNATPTAGTPFTGTYDGDNFKICNVDFTQRNYGGVFNQVNGGTIKNLTVSNITCSAFSATANGGEWGGAIVGNAGNGATLQNLVAEGTFAADHPATHNVAGIVIRACGGGENGTLIKDCTNNATLYGAYTKIGGICAIAQHKIDGGAVTFDGCVNNGDIVSSRTTTGVTGYAGILGYVDDNTVLVNCSNAGSIVNESGANTDKDGQLIGWVYSHTLTLEDAGTIAATGLAKIGDVKTTVVLDWAISGNEGKNFDFNVYGKTGSTVELLQDFTGYPVIGSSIAPALKLSANMTINNGNKNITNATFAVITGTGNLTMSDAQATRWYVITKLQNYSGTISAGSFEKVAFGDIVAEAGYGTALVKAGSNFNVDDLASTKVNGAAADLCVDTLGNQKGIYLAAAQVVADDDSTTSFASVANALAAADAAFASSVNVLDQNAAEVSDPGWTYADGVYTSAREIATLKGTSYPSLTKALAAAHDGDTVTLVAATSEAVTIPAGVTVAVTDDVVFSGKLSGAGAIKYTKAPASFNASWFVNWTGTFVAAWNATASAGTGLNVNTYGVDGSTVEIAGTFVGYPGSGSTVVATVKPTIKITGSFTAANGSSTTASVFKKITGSGTLTLGAGDKKYAVNALEDWTGVATVGSANCVLTNIVSGTGSVTYNYSAPHIWVGDDFSGSVTLAVAPQFAPTVSNESECEVVIGYNWSSNADLKWYGGSNSTITVTSFTGNNTYLPNSDVISKVRVASGGTVSINNGNPLSANELAWNHERVIQMPALKVDGTLKFEKATISGTGSKVWNPGYVAYYYANVLDASGVGSIEVGTQFALRIDAVDFAAAPTGTDCLVPLSLTNNGDSGKDAGALYGPNGVAGEIPVTVNGEATEQTLVYDAVKGGLVLYVAPTPKAAEVVGGEQYETLAEAIAAATDGATVKLLADVAAEGTTISKSLTLDLGGKTLTGRVTIDNGTVTVQNGTIAGRFDTYDSATVTLAATATVSGQAVVWGDGTFGTAGCKTPTLNVYGTITNTGDAAISCNGTDMSGAIINIYGGAVVTSTDDVAVFLPSGNLTVPGGTITGTTGIYAKSGTVTVTGGTITGNGAAAAYVYRGDGATATGDAIVIDNAGYPGGAPAPSISGGTFVSVNASAIASYAKTGLERIVHFADKSAVTITETVASAEDVFLAQGFPGGEDGKTFNIDTAVQAALAEKIPEGKALTDAVAGTTSGVTYAQAYALGLLDEETGDVEKDVTPTIEIVDGKVVVSLDATAKAGYKVMLNVYEKASLTAEWPAEPTTSYELGSETEAAGFTPSAAGAGFYKVGVTIEDAE